MSVVFALLQIAPRFSLGELERAINEADKKDLIDERRFRPIAARAGLPMPETCVMRNGWEVDFLWRDLGLVVETDGLRYHRTPAAQYRDRRREQAHLAAGDTPVSFTHGQIRYEPEDVEETLRTIASRLKRQRSKP